MHSKQIDQAVSTRARVRISERNGWAAGKEGIALGYRAAYDTIAVGFVDADGNYTGERTTVARTMVDLIEGPATATTPTTADRTQAYLKAAELRRWVLHLVTAAAVIRYNADSLMYDSDRRSEQAEAAAAEDAARRATVLADQILASYRARRADLNELARMGRELLALPDTDPASPLARALNRYGRLVEENRHLI